jgi:signal transduction histidine kinase
MFNTILLRQLKKHLGDKYRQDEKFNALMKIVSDTYDHYEKDRKLIEHTMELNSEELFEANNKLRIEAQEYRIALQTLQDSLVSLQENDDNLIKQSYKSENILDVTKLIQQETKKRKQAERDLKNNLLSLEKKNKELDQFAYVVSHDLKAPLRAISSLAEWIAEDSAASLTKESKENLIILRGRVSRMENLIHGILAYTKAGKIGNERSNVNINELLAEIIDSLNPSGNFEIKIDFAPLWIQTESVKLQQVFANLISNAIKYMDKPAGKIKIGCTKLEDSCQFYVEDNGPGIEAEYQEKIFVIFQTLSARDHVESTGIGLSIVKKIIEDQGGKIWVESKIGLGSRFVFNWPETIENIKNTVL